MRRTALLLSTLLALTGTITWAADIPTTTPAAPTDPMAVARGHIEGQRWAAAIEALTKANKTGDADWNNLMGYALRKQAKPDLDGSQRFYDAALKINPKHLGALEYSGELALMKGDLPTAEARLAALGQLCTTPCEPLDDLKKSIARYKASGKK
jgi:hypothetical protein